MISDPFSPTVVGVQDQGTFWFIYQQRQIKCSRYGSTGKCTM